MKDFDCAAVNTALNELMNVQHKKQFDIADVENIDVKLEVKQESILKMRLRSMIGSLRVFFALLEINNSLGIFSMARAY